MRNNFLRGKNLGRCSRRCGLAFGRAEVGGSIEGRESGWPRAEVEEAFFRITCYTVLWCPNGMHSPLRVVVVIHDTPHLARIPKPRMV